MLDHGAAYVVPTPNARDANSRPPTPNASVERRPDRVVCCGVLCGVPEILQQRSRTGTADAVASPVKGAAPTSTQVSSPCITSAH